MLTKLWFQTYYFCNDYLIKSLLKQIALNEMFILT